MYNFSEDLKVLSFSHFDLDGISCQIVLSNYFKNIKCLTTNYGKEENLLTQIEAYADQYDLIIITDFTPVSILSSFKMIKTPIVIIDHHETAINVANPKNNIFINTKMSAAKLTYLIFNKLKPMEYLFEFIEIVNDFDLHLGKDIRSNYFNQIYWSNLYSKKDFMKRFKEGNLKLTNEEKNLIIENKNKIKEIIENLEGTELPKNGFMTQMPKFLTEIGDYLLEKYTWIAFLNIKPEYDIYKISLRCKNDSHLNFPNICKKADFKDGGGHKSSAGVSFKNIEELKNAIKKISMVIIDE